MGFILSTHKTKIQKTILLYSFLLFLSLTALVTNER
jgi:hypothetical protein